MGIELCKFFLLFQICMLHKIFEFVKFGYFYFYDKN
jgi:hypothetical protein